LPTVKSADQIIVHPASQPSSDLGMFSPVRRPSSSEITNRDRKERDDPIEKREMHG
jgi:hypothetical protein